MVSKLTEAYGYKGFINNAMTIAYRKANGLIKHVGPRGFKYSIVALAMSLLFNLAILLFIPYRSIAYGALLFIWPILSIFLLTRIYYSSMDKNIKYVTRLFGIILVPWTAALLLKYVIIPYYGNDPLAYYIVGFGFLISYLILILGLNTFKKSKQWTLAPPTRDQIITAAGIILSMTVAFLVLLNINWNSASLDEVLLLLSYLICDIVILCQSLKLFNMNIKLNLNYLILVIAGFIAINALGDLIFESRWLFSINNILFLDTGRITDMAYSISLMSIMFALALYNTDLKDKALDKISNRLKDSRLFIDDIVMQAPYAISVYDTSGGLILANDSFLSMFNVKRADILRSYNLFSSTDPIGLEFNSGVSRIKQGKAIVMPRLEYRPPGGGTARYLSAKAFPTFNMNGGISNYVMIIEDITDRLKAEQELLEAKTQAELYVDLMGHDINNIHQVAMGYLELADDKLRQEGSLGKDSEAFILTPIDNLKKGSRLIDNVRKLRGEKKGLFVHQSIDVDKVLQDVTGHIDVPPGRDIKINYEANCGCQVMANELLKDVFINLIGNAIKHSNGPLKVDVRTRCVDENGRNLCRIVIEDDGPGIPDGRKGGIFDRMHDDQGKLTGKGLGLYLVKTLIEDYHGKVWVEDRIQGDSTKGARFVVQLPIAEK
jgi:PAS domain S-box-containing protein